MLKKIIGIRKLGCNRHGGDVECPLVGKLFSLNLKVSKEATCSTLRVPSNLPEDMPPPCGGAYLDLQLDLACCIIQNKEQTVDRRFALQRCPPGKHSMEHFEVIWSTEIHVLVSHRGEFSWGTSRGISIVTSVNLSKPINVG